MNEAGRSTPSPGLIAFSAPLRKLRRSAHAHGRDGFRGGLKDTLNRQLGYGGPLAVGEAASVRSPCQDAAGRRTAEARPESFDCRIVRRRVIDAISMGAQKPKKQTALRPGAVQVESKKQGQGSDSTPCLFGHPPSIEY